MSRRSGHASRRARRNVTPLNANPYTSEQLEQRRLLSFSVGLIAGTLLQGGDVNTSQANGSQTETHAAISSSNPANLVVTGNGGAGGNEFTANSTDAGNTFTTQTLGNIPDGLGGGSRFDGAASFDRFGNLHVAYMHRANNMAQTLSIVHASSSDGGVTFPVVTVLATGGAVDKPWIATGPDANTPGNEAVWVTYRSAGDRIVVHGATVSALGTVGAFNAATNVSDGGGGNYAVPAVGPNGELAVSWQNPSGGQGNVNIRFDRDVNGLAGGVAFGGDTTPATSNSGGFDFIPATPDRSAFASPYVAYDRSPGPNNGRLYLTYAVENPDESNDFDIVIRRSDDDGANWSGETQVNDDAGANSQFFHNISVDSLTGAVYMGWYDCRNDLNDGSAGDIDSDNAANSEVEYFATVSIDGGVTWQANLRVSDGSSDEDRADPNNNDYGDYTGIAAFGGAAFGTWCDNSNSTGDNPGGTATFDVYVDQIIYTGHALTVTGTGGDDTYFIRLDASGELLQIWENTPPLGNPTFTMFAAAVASIAVNTLGGNDIVTFEFGNGNPFAPTTTYDGGTGTGDRLVLQGGSFTNEVYTATGPSSGTITLDAATMSFANLAPIDDTVTVANYLLNAPAGDDIINVLDGPAVGIFDTTQVSSGNGTFELVNLANKATARIAGQNGADTLNINLTDPADGMNALFLYGEDQANAGDDNANDRFSMVPAAGSLSITVSGGGSTGSGDILAVDGSGGDFDITDTTITSAGVQSIAYNTVERLELTSGMFEVVGTVNAFIQVNSAATLIGTGNAAGGIFASSGGVVSPGVAGPGVLRSGNLSFAGGSNYTVNLNGTGVGLHDEINVTGNVKLSFNATLSATVGGGFASIPGDEIVIIRNDGVDAVDGVFAGGNLLDFGAAGKWTIDYGYDADGAGLAFNDVALIRYGAALAPDPCDPTKQALFVSATSGADLIEVKPIAGNASGEVFINGVSEGVFIWDGHLYVMGQNGDDTINCLMPSREVFLYGNTGNDKLNAGNNLSVLIGGFGNDVLTSGNAMDILIGGDGRDNLRGENAADIIITGGSVFDAVTAANRVKLCEIADLWRGGHQTSELTHLLNNTTLISDGDIDTAMGGLGKDYLILGVNDVDDAVKQETILFV